MAKLPYRERRESGKSTRPDPEAGYCQYIRSLEMSIFHGVFLFRAGGRCATPSPFGL